MTVNIPSAQRPQIRGSILSFTPMFLCGKQEMFLPFPHLSLLHSVILKWILANTFTLWDSFLWHSLICFSLWLSSSYDFVWKLGNQGNPLVSSTTSGDIFLTFHSLNFASIPKCSRLSLFRTFMLGEQSFLLLPGWLLFIHYVSGTSCFREKQGAAPIAP
jgi:hypothetical protein